MNESLYFRVGFYVEIYVQESETCFVGCFIDKIQYTNFF